MSPAKAMRPFLLFFGVTQVLLGALMAFAPGTFFEEIGPYGVRNDHYIGDLATWYVALGVLAVVAAQRPHWRAPVLALATLQFALHAINHLIDIGDTDPGWLGPFNFALILLTAVLLAGLLREASRTEAPR